MSEGRDLGLTMARAVDEANKYLSTDAGQYHAGAEADQTVTIDNVLDSVTLDNTMSETKA